MPVEAFFISLFFVSIGVCLFLFPDRIYDSIIRTQKEYYRIMWRSDAEFLKHFMLSRKTFKIIARVFSIIIIAVCLLMLWFFWALAPNLEPVA